MTTPAPTTAAKAWIAVIGGILTTLVPIVQSIAGYLPAPWSALITGLIALLTILGVYSVPNKTKV